MAIAQSQACTRVVCSKLKIGLMLTNLVDEVLKMHTLQSP